MSSLVQSVICIVLSRRTVYRVWQAGRQVSALDLDHADLGTFGRRRDLVNCAVCMSVVAEVERADHLVRVTHIQVGNIVRVENELARGEAVGAVERVWDGEPGIVTDEGRSQEDAAVEERHVVDGGHRQNDVYVRQSLTTFPLDHALVRAADVRHLRYVQQSTTSTLIFLNF